MHQENEREGQAVSVGEGHSWKYSQGPWLDPEMSWIFDLHRGLSQASQAEPSISSWMCTKLLLLLPSFPQGIALQGTSSQLLTSGSILNVYLLTWVLSNMAHAEDLLLVVIFINNIINDHTYMLISRGYKCGFSRTDRAEGNSGLPTAREGCQPPHTGWVA